MNERVFLANARFVADIALFVTYLDSSPFFEKHCCLITAKRLQENFQISSYCSLFGASNKFKQKAI